MQQHDQPFLAAGKGRSAQDAVWRQALRAEAAVAQGRHAATVLWDLSKFFEYLSHSRLWDEGLRLRFPVALLRLSLSMFASKRILRAEGGFALVGRAIRGLPPGHAFADAMVQLYYVRAFAEYTVRHPRTDLNVYYDDLTLANEADEEQETAAAIGVAATDLYGVVLDTLECAVNWEKESVTASSASLAKVFSSSMRM